MKLIWSSKELKLAPQQTYLIGRHFTNDVVLDGLSVSRQHARIEYKNDFFFIVNLSSQKPIFVNGVAFSFGAKALLETNTRIKIGQFSLWIQDSDQSQPQASHFLVRCQNGHIVNGRLKTCPHCGVFLAGAQTIYHQGE